MDIKGFFESKKLNDILTKDLTRREVEILSLYASGFTVGEISNILNVAKNTVRTHIKNIFTKIEIPTDANPKITLCLFYLLFRKEITRMGGFKYAK